MSRLRDWGAGPTGPFSIYCIETKGVKLNPVFGGWKLAGRDLGVFSGFSRICTPEGQENFGFSALFSAIWAFSCHFLIFVPFSHLNQETKQKKEGTKFQNFL